MAIAANAAKRLKGCGAKESFEYLNAGTFIKKEKVFRRDLKYEESNETDGA